MTITQIDAATQKGVAVPKGHWREDRPSGILPRKGLTRFGNGNVHRRGKVDATSQHIASAVMRSRQAVEGAQADMAPAAAGVVIRIPSTAHMVCRLGAVVASVLLVAGSPASADGPGDVVVLRQKEMKEIASAAKVIAGMFNMPETYSSSPFEKAARDISERADKRLLDHFGTIVAAENSKASEVISTNHDRFAELAADLKRYSDALAEAARRHPGEMTDEMRMTDGEPMEGGILGFRRKAEISSMSAEHLFHMMLQTCTSCHARFRRDR